MIRRFVLTGAPGAGKTTIAEALKLRGYAVVDEAATHVIGTVPGIEQDTPRFLRTILQLQIDREHARREAIQVLDRTPICTLALAEYLGHQPAPELENTVRHSRYQRRVFFVRLMDCIVPTRARRIGLEDARRFERIHADVYQRLGYELVDIPPAPLEARVAQVIAGIGRPATTGRRRSR
ncbi:AAA family ATPase [Dactylosporangium sp. CS-047395]|uniref:AAA family ATPase n=1 Tax=Dactylosporangium sp. CS-047395 TaxID=3239936 RepID=UPI003D8C567F